MGVTPTSFPCVARPSCMTLMIGETTDDEIRSFVPNALVRLCLESNLFSKPAPSVDGSSPTMPVVAADGQQHREDIAKSDPMSKGRKERS